MATMGMLMPQHVEHVVRMAPVAFRIWHMERLDAAMVSERLRGRRRERPREITPTDFTARLLIFFFNLTAHA